MTPCQEFSKEIVSLQNIPQLLPTHYHTIHSIHGDGQMKIEVPLRPLCLAQSVNKRLPVPDRQNTIKMKCQKILGPWSTKNTINKNKMCFTVLSDRKHIKNMHKVHLALVERACYSRNLSPMNQKTPLWTV